MSPYMAKKTIKKTEVLKSLTKARPSNFCMYYVGCALYVMNVNNTPMMEHTPAQPRGVLIIHAVKMHESTNIN